MRDSTKKADLEKRKKRRIRRLYWLLAHLVLTLVILALLMYKPGYDPIEPYPAGSRRVSRYFTHDLYKELYNGAQLGEPFDLVVTQEGINDMVASSDWPKYSGDATVSAPAVLLVPDKAILMGTATVKGVEFVVTVILEPVFDEEGLLNLRVAKVRIGAMNITILARMMAKRMYREQMAVMPADKDDWRAMITASLLNGQAFDPIIKVADERLRVETITVGQEKLILHLTPISD